STSSDKYTVLRIPEKRSLKQPPLSERAERFEQFDGGIDFDNLRDTGNTCGDSSYGNLLDEEETDDDVGDEKEYESSDSVCLADEDSNFDDSIYTTKFLNGLRMSDMPHHSIKLKIGTPIMFDA
ncbi:ATP-dependent DNA helicase PIF1-like protein, partial [Tanacetum coccineum]